MNDKEKYRILCERESTIPIFSRDWWMDTVCGKENWDVLTIENDYQIIAALPYYFKKRLGRIYISQPKLTQKNGIWIMYPNSQKYSTKLSYEIDTIEKLINKIERLNIAKYNQNYDYSFTNWLPFYWESFKQTTRYTYVIDNIKELDRVYRDFHHNIKNSIRKAEKLVEVREDLDLEEFYKVCVKTFHRQNKKIPYTLEFLKRIDSSCMDHKCKKIFYAVDSMERINCVLYVIWDENSAYALIGGGDPELRNSQAMTLLIWKAIQFTSNVTKKFDFEGSMIKSIESFFRNYGGKQMPYFNISKDFMAGNIIYDVFRNIYDRAKK